MSGQATSAHVLRAHDRLSTAALLARIAEFDARKLYLPAPCTSMFAYCVGKLHMSEDAAAKRIHAARTAREFPVLFQAVADGRLHLSGLVLLAPHLTADNAEGLLSAASHLSKAAIERLIAQRFPVSDALPIAAQASASGPDQGAEPLALRSCEPVAEVETPPDVTKSSSEHAPGHVGAQTECDTPATSSGPALHAKVKPIAPGRYELVAVIDEEAYTQLLGSKELLGHANPSGALVEVVRRAIAVQFAQLRKRRCAATERPRRAAPGRSTNPRHVPADVVRAVWERDGNQCAFVGTNGHRCESRERLELDHIVPVARGGGSTVENLRLLCRAHNQYAAEREFGKAAIEGKREAARRRCVEERLRKQADRERTEARRAEIARQDTELGDAFRNLGYRGTDLARALAHCATRPEAPLEERLRHALQYMAPRPRREPPGASASA